MGTSLLAARGFKDKVIEGQGHLEQGNLKTSTGVSVAYLFSSRQISPQHYDISFIDVQGQTPRLPIANLVDILIKKYLPCRSSSTVSLLSP